ncbi:non-specific lipid-transfer protein-like 1 isoform X2 [Vitis riparia]|uniref:non-specific lipid-transfer protein-like 1 isoform X2 n=1 Tax=Vitis riparia TaxID=96939 RepID=UPI00155A1128|nr:non-specific lipid-transfer protein-like 1 isoform X2 [Vitis riparia]
MANSTSLKSDAVLEQMKLHLATDAGKQLTKKIGLVYQINIAPKKIGFNEEIYIVDLKKGEVTKGPYEGGKPDATFSFKDEDFVKVATGKMNPQIAFLSSLIWTGVQGRNEDKGQFECGTEIHS